MNEKEIMKYMDNIEYGWIDRNNVKHIDDYDDFSSDYILQSPKEVINNNIGVCWDQVELERYYFKDIGYYIKTYFIVHYDNDKCPTHSFLVFKKDNKYYWFEHSWEMFRGIYEYTTMKELLLDVKNKFIKYELDNNYDINNLFIYEYSIPKYNISVKEFYKHCEEGKVINIDNIKFD